MKRRLLALGLALCLTAALTACGGGEEPAPTGDAPAESPAPSAAPSVAPDAPAVEHETLPTGPAAEPSATPEPSASPAPSAAPSEGQVASHPIVTPAPSQTPSEAPSEAPAKSVTAAEVYTAVSQAASVSYDDATAYIDAYYTTLSTSDLADYVLYQPAMSAQIEEIFIAKVNSGKMDAVKAACKDRQAAMAEDAAFYVDTGAYVDSYQLVSEGDWVLFCVGANASGAATAFKDAVK